MKKSLTIWIADLPGKTYGPYNWMAVRLLNAYGIIPEFRFYDEDSKEWRPISENSKISELPISVSREVQTYTTMPGVGGPTDFQKKVWKIIGAPPIEIFISHYVVFKLLNLLLMDGNTSLDATTNWRISIDASYAWMDDPATPRQIEYLRGNEISIPDGLTKGGAGCLMEESMTAAQARRLAFVKCPFHEYTKKEASEIIDSYFSEFSGAEEEYQAWKVANGMPASKPFIPYEEWVKSQAAGQNEKPQSPLDSFRPVVHSHAPPPLPPESIADKLKHLFHIK